MHIKPTSLARQIFAGALLAVGLLLAGCDIKLTNLTPPSLAENPSQIYTLSLRVSHPGGTMVKGSLTPYIVIGGQSYKMNKSSLSDDLYDFDYQLPAGQDEVAYYFLVQYKIESNGFPRDRETYTAVMHAKIARRYVLSLEVTRGPVGARVSVLGRGFSAQDSILFDDTPARTVFDSANSLSFFVPAVSPSRNYKISLQSPAGNSPVGTFRVDGASVQVFPAALVLKPGQKQTLTFTLPLAATQGGVLLDITTDVPECIIMPEVLVPAGQNTVTVTVQGGKKGSGQLFLKGFGQGELTIPVTVQ